MVDELSGAQRQRVWLAMALVVAVLHDLNLALRYSTNVIVLSEGEIVAHGPATEVIDAQLIARVFHLPCRVIADPETGTPLVVLLAPKI